MLLLLLSDGPAVPQPRGTQPSHRCPGQMVAKMWLIVQRCKETELVTPFCILQLSTWNCAMQIWHWGCWP